MYIKKHIQIEIIQSNLKRNVFDGKEKQVNKIFV